MKQKTKYFILLLRKVKKKVPGYFLSSLTKNDAMSGAIAGVAGELIAEIANENEAIIKKD